MLCTKPEHHERLLTLESFVKDISVYKLGDSLKMKEAYFTLTQKSQDSFLFNYIIPIAHEDISKKAISKFSYMEYKEMNRSEQNIIIENGMDKNDIYVILYDKKPYMFILFSDSNIRSFITLNKGAHRYFMPL